MALTSRTRGGLGSALAFLLGCAPVTVHPPRADAATPTHVRRAEHDWTRHLIPAHGVQLHATLWDAELVASALATEQPGPSAATWTRRYLEQTAFTVVVELEDRRPIVDPTPLLRADAWRFALGTGDEEPATDPADVDLLLVDRFPTLSGAHHHRLVFAVFFPGPLVDAARASSVITLNVRPVLAEGETAPRSMLGQRMLQRGDTLRWRVEAQ